jgi:asparagine synthase (glutamine-hydrolysing)
MCGINGIAVSSADRPVTVDELVAMRDSMSARGPDDKGCYIGQGIGMGSRRLSILDLSEHGHMPMSTPDGRHWIVYNGEVYNFAELRQELTARGVTFRSDTDTEVVLWLYVVEGPAMLDRLNGMFALAIWDSVTRTLFLARDRLGIKPLFYAVDQDRFLFASEIKGIFAAGMERRFDHTKWEELLMFRFTAGRDTPYVGVKRLLPGHYLMWESGGITTRRWWALSQRSLELRNRIPEDPVRWYRETFNDSVRLRMVSDVPVGVLLSGGLDSSSVAVTMSEHSASKLSSFTVGFEETEYDERNIARRVAAQCVMESHELVVPESQLLDLLLEASFYNDEPLVHSSSAHMLALSRIAKSKVSVLHSGEGSDETLGGYVRYGLLTHPLVLPFARPVLTAAMSGFPLDGRVGKLGRFLSLRRMSDFVLFDACDVLPNELRLVGLHPTFRFPYRAAVLQEAELLYPRSPRRQAMYLDLHTFLCSVLDRNDRMTMGASIECRVPFLDYRLVEMLSALPSRAFLNASGNKQLLRSALGRRLPTEVLKHRKWGFGVPWHRYMLQCRDIRDVLVDLPSHRLVLDSPLDRQALRRLIGRFLGGRSAQVALLFQILSVVLSWDANRGHG